MPSTVHLRRFRTSKTSTAAKATLARRRNECFASRIFRLGCLSAAFCALFSLSKKVLTSNTGPSVLQVVNDDQFSQFQRSSAASRLVHALAPYYSPMSEQRRFAAEQNTSVVVLFHGEYSSLDNSLRSWLNHGLIQHVDELLLFLNGLPKGADRLIKKQVAAINEVPSEKLRIIQSQENLPLGLAITRMVELASYEYILLLEKDWELIEPLPVMRSRLTDSKLLISNGIAHVVRHRHRHDPGIPLHALIMHQGREESILRIQKNLLCYTHHWQSDPTMSYPAKGIMYRCGKGASSNVEEEDVFCAPSDYCQWTNNPSFFNRDWFINEIGERFKTDYQVEKDKEGDDSPFLDFEYYTNWRSDAWTDKNITVALGTGLFSHTEVNEQTNFNTFWYAYYRLTVDLEEIRSMYLKNETRFKKLGGVHYNPDSPKPPTMWERYPVDFVRRYQWKDVFTGTLETQREMIQTEYDSFVRDYRVLAAEEENSTVLTKGNAAKPIPWRLRITGLHSVVEKAMMIAPPEQPHEMSITLVTVLLDIGRHKLGEDEYQFRRDFKMYLDAMEDWLSHSYPKVVYTSEEIANELLKRMPKASSSTKFVLTTREELRTKWIGADNYAKIQQIRTSKQWVERASWLKNSPQAGLKDYNPLVMAKMYIMRDAARENYWKTSHFLFIDAKHNCLQPKVFNPQNDHIIRAHMFDKLLMTNFDYVSNIEVHGFEYVAFNRYCNRDNSNDRRKVVVGRGGIFGGSAFVLEYMTAMYDILLTATLREGLMGTEENIFSMLHYQVPQYVDAFSNNWACPEKVEGDHSCPDRKDEGYNCAIFEWVARDAVRDD